MASPITWADVISLPGAVTELATVPAGGQTMILAFVNTNLDVDMFDGEAGPQMKLARCFYAAHLAALGKLGSGGAITAESIAGVLSRAYAMPAVADDLGSTSYGRAYRMLIGSKARGPRLL